MQWLSLGDRGFVMESFPTFEWMNFRGGAFVGVSLVLRPRRLRCRGSLPSVRTESGRGGPRVTVSILLDSLLSWGRTPRRDALPAAPPLGPQRSESAAAALRGSSGPDPPRRSACRRHYTETDRGREIKAVLKLHVSLLPCSDILPFYILSVWEN